MKLDVHRTASLACAFVAAMGFTACGGNNSSRTERNTTGTTGYGVDNTSTVAANAQMTMTGCLQKEDGILGDYILTQVNAPESAGTSGASGTVERRQAEAASRSYRLSGESGKLRGLVGHEVRVMGDLLERGNLASDRATTRDSGSVIKGSDLARFDVTSVENVSDACASGPRQAAPSND